MIQRLAADLIEWPEFEDWFVENAKALAITLALTLA